MYSFLVCFLLNLFFIFLFAFRRSRFVSARALGLWILMCDDVYMMMCDVVSEFECFWC